MGIYGRSLIIYIANHKYHAAKTSKMAADRTYVVVVKRSVFQNRPICLVGDRRREVVVVKGKLKTLNPAQTNKHTNLRGEFEVVAVRRWSLFNGGP